MSDITNGKVTRKTKTKSGGRGPHFLAVHPPKSFVGSLPPVTQEARPCNGRVQESEQSFCNAGCNASRITKGEETLGTSESTVKATEDFDPPGPPGGRSPK